MGIIYKNGIPYGNQPNGTVPSGGTTGQVLKKVSNTDYDTEWANESGGGGGTSDIAEEYDPISGVYSVGDYCIYQTVLYKCITAISTPEAFDSTKWSEVTVGDELNGVKNTLNSKADKSDLASLNLTGTTNTTGSQINAETYFYLNGALVKAKVDIANSATFTSGTNYETVTAGGLNALQSAYKKLNDNTRVYAKQFTATLHSGVQEQIVIDLTEFNVSSAGVTVFNLVPNCSEIMNSTYFIWYQRGSGAYGVTLGVKTNTDIENKSFLLLFVKA